MTRHYGRYIGERITYPVLVGERLRGKVVGLSATDNNCCYVLFNGHNTPKPCVAEWCKHCSVLDELTIDD